MEIKFRIWNGDMIYLKPTIGKYDFENGIVLSFVEDGYAEFGAHEKYDVDTSNIKIMQYIGRKDSKGKDMYDGDIVKCVATEDYPNYDRITDIGWHRDLSWMVRQPSRDGILFDCGLPITWGGWESIEVIGNIYQNPELLNN